MAAILLAGFMGLTLFATAMSALQGDGFIGGPPPRSASIVHHGGVAGVEGYDASTTGVYRGVLRRYFMGVDWCDGPDPAEQLRCRAEVYGDEIDPRPVEAELVVSVIQSKSWLWASSGYTPQRYTVEVDGAPMVDPDRSFTCDEVRRADGGRLLGGLSDDDLTRLLNGRRAATYAVRWKGVIELGVLVVVGAVFVLSLRAASRLGREVRAIGVGVCAACGYSLEGLPARVCPECGRSWDGGPVAGAPGSSGQDDRAAD